MQSLVLARASSQPVRFVPIRLLTDLYAQYPPGATIADAPYGVLFVEGATRALEPTGRTWALSKGWCAHGLERGQKVVLERLAPGGASERFSAGITEDGRLLHGWGLEELDLKCDRPDGVPESVMTWLRQGRRGASSEALCRGLFPQAPLPLSFAHPHDAEDLGRCIDMLDQVDPSRAGLSNLVPMSAVWGRLIKQWEGLESQFKAADWSGISRTIRHCEAPEPSHAAPVMAM